MQSGPIIAMKETVRHVADLENSLENRLRSCETFLPQDLKN